jgi:Fe-S-cluster-containing hydrogenase component 2
MMIKEFERTGLLTSKDLILPTEKQLKKGVAISECIQLIPCDPCVDSCPVNAIYMNDINSIPVIDYDTCIACGKCIGVCPGLALFVVKTSDEKGFVTLPFEFLPVPENGQTVDALDREGKKIDTGVVRKIIKVGKTWIITIEIDRQYVMDIRNIRVP